MKSTEKLQYKTGEQSYNRESGQKTLVFVGICILLIIVFSIFSLILMNA